MRGSWRLTLQSLRRVRLVALTGLILLLVSAPAAAGAAVTLPPVRHVFVIVAENKAFDETFGYLGASPYLSLTLPSQGAFVPNFYGVTHLSLGNYIALVSGQGSNPVTQADCPVFLPVLPGTIGGDGQALGSGCVYPSSVQTVAGQLSARGMSWKGYMEDMQGGGPQTAVCRHPAIGAVDSTQSAHRSDQYAARHNPFVYFSSIINSPACAQNDVPLERLPADLAHASTTASFSLITPNLCHDGHDVPCVDGSPGGLKSVDSFLRQWVPRILASPAYRADGLLAVVFDESDGSDASACCGEPQFPNTPSNGGPTLGPGGGRTGAVLLSPFIDPGTVDLTPYNHFSLLRSVEDLFGLDHLGYAARSGLSSLGADAFTCFRGGFTPHVVRGRLPAGSLIKLAVIGQGTAPRPSVEVKLWSAGRLLVSAAPSGRRGARLRRVGRAQTVSACQLAKVGLPYRHGRLVLRASSAGLTELRVLGF